MSINLSTALYARLDSELPGWEKRKAEASRIADNSFYQVLVQSEITNNKYLIRKFNLSRGFVLVYDLAEDKVSWISEKDLSSLTLSDEECLLQDELDRIPKR